MLSWLWSALVSRLILATATVRHHNHKGCGRPSGRRWFDSCRCPSCCLLHIFDTAFTRATLCPSAAIDATASAHLMPVTAHHVSSDSPRKYWPANSATQAFLHVRSSRLYHIASARKRPTEPARRPWLKALIKFSPLSNASLQQVCVDVLPFEIAGVLSDALQGVRSMLAACSKKRREKQLQCNCARLTFAKVRLPQRKDNRAPQQHAPQQ